MKLTPSLRRLNRTMTRAVKRLSAFTLIEILVVISIIAVLASLLFPAMSAVRTQARKTSAKNDITNLVNAVRNFQVDYGRYPLPAGVTEDQKYSTDNNVIIEALTGTNKTINPRAIRYIEVPEKKDSSGNAYEGNKAKSSLDKNGVWRDPWGNPYVIFIDGDYDDKLDDGVVSPYSGVNTAVGALSSGTDGNATTKTDNVISWQ